MSNWSKRHRKISKGRKVEISNNFRELIEKGAIISNVILNEYIDKMFLNSFMASVTEGTSQNPPVEPTGSEDTARKGVV